MQRAFRCEVRGPEQYLAAVRQLQLSRYRHSAAHSTIAERDVTFNVDMDIYGEGEIARAQLLTVQWDPLNGSVV